MSLEDWCIKYGKQILYDDTEIDHLVFDPAIFNVAQRVMRVHKGGNKKYLRDTFEIDDYLTLAIVSIKGSFEYEIMKGLEVLLDYDKKLLENVLKYIYVDYVADLLITQCMSRNIGSIP
jgi:hypothetical protein